MSTNGIAVYCKGVAKTYTTGSTKVLALRGVDLDVRLGELLMLVGPSGCGKTTLISVVAGILDHDEGECLVFQQDVRAMGQTQKTRYRGANIGFVFQAYNLIPTLSVSFLLSSPEGSNSGWPLPGLWCIVQDLLFATNRPAPWTLTPVGWSWGFFGRPLFLRTDL